MSTLVTGAFGRVGTALIDHADESRAFTYLDRFEHPDLDGFVGDVADYPTVAAAAADVDDVVHLAAASRLDDPWPAVLSANLVGAYNCFEVARREQLDRVVLASTNHVVGMHERERAPELYEREGGRFDRDTTPRPDSLYAVSKVFGEALGRYYVENHDYPKRVYALRFGSVRSPRYDHPYADAELGVDRGEWERNSDAYDAEVRRMKSTWQSRRDAASLIERCLDDESVTFDVFYGVSDNPRSCFDLDHARRTIGYRPVDSSSDWTAPPDGGVRDVDGSVADAIDLDTEG